MSLIYAKENIIENIDKLPIEILNELNDFMEFLIFKNSLRYKDKSKREILNDLNESAKEMKLVLEGKLEARPIEKLLNEL